MLKKMCLVNINIEKRGGVIVYSMLKIMYVHLFLLNFAKIFYIINFVCGEFNFYPTCGEENMDKLKILLAKGRIYESVYELLNDCLLYTSPSPRDS